MLLAGVPVKVVSEMLGHADIATTLRIYAHYLPDTQDDAARLMDGVMRSAIEQGELAKEATREADTRRAAMTGSDGKGFDRVAVNIAVERTMRQARQGRGAGK